MIGLIVKTMEGLEHLLARELKSIGATDIHLLNRAVACQGDLSILYRSNIMLRTALKVLVPITEVEVTDEHRLYDEIYAMPWEKIFDVNQTFAIDATTSSEVFTHSKYVALKAKDAIVDRFRDRLSKRPNVNPISPDIALNIHIRDTTATISLDSSGESLHMRGYRINTVEAPLNEVLAAGMILMSGWDKRIPFWDPMCGSGTIAIEATKIANGIPPQFKSRKYLFENWKNFDKGTYERVQVDAFDTTLHKKVTVIASDKSMQAIHATEVNASEAGVKHLMEIKMMDFFKAPLIEKYMIITNPPYDERLKIVDVAGYYAALGAQISRYCKDSTAWVISGNDEGMDNIGLTAKKKIELKNGPLITNYYKFDTNLVTDEEE